MHAVIESGGFVADAKRTRLSEADVFWIVDTIARDPASGVRIPGTGGARKVRFAGRGKGKRGGYRVVTYFAGRDMPVFLLNVFAKGDRIDLSQADRNAIRAELAALAADYKRMGTTE